MPEVASVDVIYLEPNARRTIGVLRQLRLKYDAFVNLYDLSDETGLKITQFLAANGVVFTGAGAPNAEIYDPPRMDLKVN